MFLFLQRLGADEDDGRTDELDLFDALLYLWGDLDALIFGHLAYGSSLTSSDAANSARLRALVPLLSLSQPQRRAFAELKLLSTHFRNFLSYYGAEIVDGQRIEMTSEWKERWIGDRKAQWWCREALVAESVGRKSPCSAGMRADNREEMLACRRVSSD